MMGFEDESLGPVNEEREATGSVECETEETTGSAAQEEQAPAESATREARASTDSVALETESVVNDNGEYLFETDSVLELDPV